MTDARMGVALTGVAALPPAVLWTVALFGRTSWDALSARWLVACALAWAALVIWTGGPRPAWLGLLPVAALSGAAVAVLYVSPEAYHAWVFTSRPKGLLVPVTVLLALGAPALTS